MSEQKYFSGETKRAAKNAAQRRCNPGWYQRHKAEVLRKSALRATTTKAKYKRLLYIASKKAVTVDLPFLEYEKIVANPCFYCGGDLSRIGHGLDRIDPDFGYIRGNVRPCCKRCNLAKNDMKEKEFHQWLTRVLSYWKPDPL